MGRAIHKSQLRRGQGLRSAMALVAALLVMLGLAATGLVLPERADARPLVPRDVQHVNAIGGRASPPEVSAPAAVRAAATAAARVADVGPAAAGAPPPVHLDADLRRHLRRLPIEARAPPGRLLA